MKTLKKCKSYIIIFVTILLSACGRFIPYSVPSQFGLDDGASKKLPNYKNYYEFVSQYDPFNWQAYGSAYYVFDDYLFHEYNSYNITTQNNALGLQAFRQIQY
ncbi:MAG: hypothetical protein AB7S69_10380 [Salinivirgaceae bacterium]